MEPSSGNKPASTMMVVVAFAIVYIVWGSTYFFIRLSVEHIPPMLLGALRFVTAGVLMLLWCLARVNVFLSGRICARPSSAVCYCCFSAMALLIWCEQYLASFPCRDLTGCRADLVRPAGQTQLA